MGQAQGSTRAADTPAEPAPEPKKGIPGMIEKCVGAGKNVAGTGVGAVGAVGQQHGVRWQAVQEADSVLGWR